ncbi:hypothetical protein [Sansalvadorimonas verongulae]|uniref:hypothetical protein n=1 Tax=Sansalvadorimonas verongulae TaxID=2172824 RepID=UPI0012BD1C1E|nr:hypothetical protein [Sansalvadorimonas verongulae]MTI12804.1 hypothetical protein [Sansalvadorimonas verongulae]
MKFVEKCVSLARICTPLVAVSGGVQADDIRLDELYAIRYGKVIACHSLSADHDGTYIFDRYLLAPSRVTSKNNILQEFVDDNALADLEKGSAERSKNSNRMPFYHEHYRLDGQFNIDHGTVTKGELSLSGSRLFMEDIPAEYCRFADDKLEPCGDGQCQNIPGLTLENVVGINLPDDDHTMVTHLAMPSGTSPLILVAHGWSKHYQQVYDPLHRLYDATALTSDEFGDYTYSSASTVATLGLLSSAVTLSIIPAALTVGSGLALPLSYLSAGAILACIYTSLNTSQPPPDRVKNRQQALAKELADVESHLTKTRTKREVASKLLRERYGLMGDSQEELKGYLQVYGNRTSEHYINTLAERDDLEKLEGQLREAEQELKAINEKGKTIHQLNIRLQELDNQIASLSRGSLRADVEEPYSQPDVVLQSEDKLPLESLQGMAFSAGDSRQQQNQLEFLKFERRNLALERDYLVLESQSLVRTRGTVQNAMQRIHMLKDSLNRKDTVYEREIGEPKRLLEGHLAVIENLASLIERRGVLNKKIDEVGMHRELLMLINLYQEYQRQPR